MPRQHLKRRADGRYACRYKGRMFMGKTEREALEAREAYKLQEKQGMKKDADHTTVREYASRWLPVHRHDASSRHYNDCANHLNVLIDCIGDMIVHDVTPSDIKSVWVRYDGKGESTLKHASVVFRSLFDTAVQDGYCRTNPAKSDKAARPKGYEGTHREITDEQRSQILANSDHPFHGAVMVMLYAGLRRGEALAVDTDRDIDRINHCIYVRQAVRYDSNQPIVDDTKTKAGVRTVPLVKILQDTIEPMRGLLAPADDGMIMSQSAFTSAWNSYCTSIETRINGHHKRWHHRTKGDPMRPILERMEKRGQHEQAEAMRLADWKTFDVRPHDLRHSFCTMIRDAGVDIKLAVKWMGHADEKMILKIYDHITQYRTEQAVGNIEKMLSRMQNGRQKTSKKKKAQ